MRRDDVSVIQSTIQSVSYTDSLSHLANLFSNIRVGAMTFCEFINKYMNKGVRNAVSPYRKVRDTFTRSGVNALFPGGVLSPKPCRCPPHYWEMQTSSAFMSSAELFVSGDQFPEDE
jgi:hypothetical protein